MRSHSFFLLNKNEFFSGRMGGVWDVLVSLSTRMCLGHSSLLGQCQKCIELRPSLLRKLCIFSAVGMIDFWRYCSPEEVIFFPASSESVMTRIWCASMFSKADARPIRIAINSASNEVILFERALSVLITLLSFHTCAMTVADPVVLTLPSEITAMSLDDL